MFSNKGNQEGNTNKNSSGSNHAAGDDNTIKNKNNNIHTNNSNFNHSNNTYNISHNYNGNIGNKRKNIIKSIFPSKKNSNTHNIIIGWVYLVLIILTHIARNFLPIESNPHPSNPPSISQTPTAVLSASTTPASPSISATYSASSLPSVQTVSPLPSNSLSSKTQDSPAPATRPEGSPSNKITIEVSDNPHSGKKLAPGKYQISGSGYAEISTWWTSISYNNTVSSNDCEIVLTVEGPAPVKGETRTAKCTDSSGTDLTFSEPGDYTINIEDKQSGAKSSRVIQIVK